MPKADWPPLLLCSAVETGLNTLIAQSHPQFARTQLSGAIISLQLSQLRFPLVLICQSQRVQVLSSFAGTPDVSVTLDITTLNQLREGTSLTELIKQDKLQLQGDLQLLQLFSRFLLDNPFDPAEYLSPYLGDAASHMLVSTAATAQRWTQAIVSHTRQHVGELAREEYRIAPGQLEFVHFSDQIDTLATQTLKAEQRLQSLMDRITT